MPEALEQAVHWTARGIEVVGIAVIVIGGAVASVYFARCLIGGSSFDVEYHKYRSNLGRAILLGLEFLVAADIINTVALEPTFQSLGVLAAIVLVRTFLSFALEVEIDGHWPWEESKYAQGKEKQQGDVL